MSAVSVEDAVASLLAEAHMTRGDQLPGLARRYVAAFGGTDVAIFLADLQQTRLQPFHGVNGSPAPEFAQSLPIDSTLAGRAFQVLEVQLQTMASMPGVTVAWVPLLDGTERLGVVAVPLTGPPEVGVGLATEARLRTFASLLAELTMTKTLYGDAIVRTRRTSAMGLPAEMQWSLLPPLTFACDELTLAAALEPAYDVAGDTVDYAVDGDTARVALFDGMGHGLASAQLAVLAVAAYRNARRNGLSLEQTVVAMDQAVLEGFGGTAFVTSVLGELDIVTGILRWVNVGHPTPLLLRHGRAVKSLSAPPRPPLGIPLPVAQAHLRTPRVGVEHLEPGDCVLLYTDGVTEARSRTGDFFGEERLVDLIVRNLASGLPVPETMRRVVRALLAHQDGLLNDDASLLLIQWPTDVGALMIGTDGPPRA